MKALLILASLVVSIQYAHADTTLNNLKKEAVINDDYIKANLVAISSDYEANCMELTSERTLSLYNRNSIIRGVNSRDNFDLRVDCTEISSYSPLPVSVDFLGHFSYHESGAASVVLDAIVTSTPGFSTHKGNFLPMLPKN